MTNTFKGFALAVSMLTIIPFFKVHKFYKGINGYSVMFYPLVGFLIGLILWGFSILLINLLPPLENGLSSYTAHIGIIIFSLLLLITGALHVDGLSDTIDGLFVDKSKSLEVMKDSHVGSMGMTFSVVFLMLKASSLALFSAFELLPIVLMLSRFNAVLAIYMFPYISKDGMGALAKEELKIWQVIIASLYVVALAFSHLSLIIISLLVLALCSLFFMKRYGGFSGDIYGFSIEVTELILLNAILAI